MTNKQYMAIRLDIGLWGSMVLAAVSPVDSALAIGLTVLSVTFATLGLWNTYR